MKTIRNFRLKILVIFLLLFCACTIPAFSNTFDTSTPPSPPSSPPQLINPVSAKAVDETAAYNAGKVVINYKLSPGWNIISFPMASVDSAAGFTHKIYRYESGRYYPFDPVNEPSSISTRFGYFAWADKPANVQLIGTPNKGLIRSIHLSPGWNMVGCPSINSIPLSRLVVYEGNHICSLIDATKPGKKGDRLISPNIFGSGNLKEPLDLSNKNASTKPGRTAWIFAYYPLKLTVAGRSTGEAIPNIKTVRPPKVTAGEELTIEGTGFDDGPGFVTISGIRVPDDSIISWEDSRIRLKTPVHITTGMVIVYSNRNPGNSFPLKVTPFDYADGILEGDVVDNMNHSLTGVKVLLDNGQYAVTNDSGYYIIRDVPEGAHTMSTSKLGYKMAHGKISIEKGKTHKVLISLSPVHSTPETLNPPPPPPSDSPEGVINNTSQGLIKSSEQEKGHLQVIVDAYDDGTNRWWPKKIDVGEVGNLNYYWYKDYDHDYGDTWYEVDCPGVRVGKTYRIRVLWATKKGARTQWNTWDRKIYKQDQTETIDSLY